MTEESTTAAEAKIAAEQLHGHSHAAHGHANQLTRLKLPRGQRPIIHGQDGSQWKDIYHFILNAPWSQFILGLAGVFLTLNALFAGLYLLDSAGINNARPGSFMDVFFFSVQTFGSIGYGLLAPKSIYINIVVTFESFISLMYLAIATGLIFSRFSRPFARVVFSNVAVIVPFNGVPTLMFRAANQRGNLILDATATVSFARQVITTEGINMRRFEELKLVRSRTPLFALSWTVMHQIDETSPLYGVSPDTLHDQDVDLIVLLSGTDETLAQLIYSRYDYSAEDILFDRRFVDVLDRTESGRIEVDLRHFHETKPWSAS